MKKLVFTATLIFCAFIGRAQNKENVAFQAEIANKNGDTIRILNGGTGKEIKKIGMDKSGVF